MHALALQPFEILDYQATETISAVERSKERAKRIEARIAQVLFIETLPKLHAMRKGLRRAVEFLNSPALDEYTAEQLKVVAHRAGQVQGRVAKILKAYEKFGLCDKFLYRSILAEIREANDYMRSIVEGLRLSLVDGFGDIMENISEELRKTKSQRSSSLAPLHAGSDN